MLQQSSWQRPLAAYRRGAVEGGLDRVEGDVGPALRVHELFPAPIEKPLVVLRDVPFGDEPGILRVRPGMPGWPDLRDSGDSLELLPDLHGYLYLSSSLGL